MSVIRSILIEFSDVLGWNDSIEHRDAFHKAFKELGKLFIERAEAQVWRQSKTGTVLLE